MTEPTMTPTDYQGADACWSPNFGDRKEGLQPSIIVLHYTGMGTGQEAQDWLCNPDSNVSCHYLVHEDGRIIQMVPESKRAWHAGAGSWHGEHDINSRSVGIEIVNVGHPELPAFPDKQVDAVISLTQAIITRHKIELKNVIGHSDMAPGRKIDPGEMFPWKRLAEAGVALHIDPEPILSGRFFAQGEVGEPIEALQAMLALYGFEQSVDGVFDERTKAQIEAFQRRHRPEKVDGVADVSTIMTLRNYLGLIAQV
ncbi:MAG: N-acetylmuramoyl-L-alanine amidase [Pseudomonadota bacterium]